MFPRKRWLFLIIVFFVVLAFKDIFISHLKVRVFDQPPWHQRPDRIIASSTICNIDEDVAVCPNGINLPNGIHSVANAIGCDSEVITDNRPILCDFSVFQRVWPDNHLVSCKVWSTLETLPDGIQFTMSIWACWSDDLSFGYAGFDDYPLGAIVERN